MYRLLDSQEGLYSVSWLVGWLVKFFNESKFKETMYN